MNIVLASTSPRRAVLLRDAGVVFDVLAVSIDETKAPDETPDTYIKRMVQQKANQACRALLDQQATLILTADTIGVLTTGEILGKPVDKADAFAMWDKLSGKTHEIWTAVNARLVADGQIISERGIKVVTLVGFVCLSDEQKEAYWATGEPCDKAGAYAIQGGASSWIKNIQGSYTNVVGLPVDETLQLIERATHDQMHTH